MSNILKYKIVYPIAKQILNQGYGDMHRMTLWSADHIYDSGISYSPEV